MHTDIQDNLKKTVNILAKDIGSRGYLQFESLEKTANYITSELTRYGYAVYEQSYEAKGNVYKNLIAEVEGNKSPEKILLIGAHYDTVTGSPGADDNASGVAGILELARLLRNHSLDKTLRLVAFTLEEPPFYRTKQMGSYIYAQSLYAEKTLIEGMVSLEMIGYFSDSPGSQYFPFSFFRFLYPAQGNFITLVGNLKSKGFLERVKDAFRKGCNLPVETISAPPIVPGIDFSDNWSFGEFGYNAIMVTDTAFYRNPNYHVITDTPDTLDYKRMADVVLGLKAVIEKLTANQDYS